MTQAFTRWKRPLSLTGMDSPLGASIAASNYTLPRYIRSTPKQLSLFHRTELSSRCTDLIRRWIWSNCRGYESLSRYNHNIHGVSNILSHLPKGIFYAPVCWWRGFINKWILPASKSACFQAMCIGALPILDSIAHTPSLSKHMQATFWWFLDLSCLELILNRLGR